MKQRKKTQLHVVRDKGEVSFRRFYENRWAENKADEEIEKQIKKNRRQRRMKMGLLILVTVAFFVSVFLYIYMQTYTSGKTLTSYHTEQTNNNNYCQFASGVLKYSRDGIAYLNRKSEENWNHPYQIKNPIVETYQKAAVVADKGGNYIAVFDEDGLKGEIQTTLPIEKVSVSAQGIVSTLLKNDNAPQIVCYDSAGNILVELKTTFSTTGYPMDISISEDGTLLLVSYMCVIDAEVTTKVVYYDFSGENTLNKEFEAASDTYAGMVAPSVFFVNKSLSVVVGDDRLLFYRQEEGKPKLSQTINLEKEIKSVFYNEKYIGLVLKNEGKAGYELCLYNTSAKKVLSEDFTGDYTNVKIDGRQILMYDGRKCSVFTTTGIHRFDGELQSDILEIFPTMGINRYIVMSENGMEAVRFVK